MSTQGQSQGELVQNPNEIGSLVRSWIHYDKMASSFYKQTLNARKIRSDFESKINQTLNKNKMENAIIQVNGGRLGLVKEKQPATLTMLKIEELLHSYFKTTKQTDKSGEILDFIRQNRGLAVQTRLRYL